MQESFLSVWVLPVHYFRKHILCSVLLKNKTNIKFHGLTQTSWIRIPLPGCLKSSLKNHWIVWVILVPYIIGVCAGAN
jgi:hypothetical protein